MAQTVSEPATSEPGRREVRSFDVRRPNKLNRDHTRNLQIIHETFAGQLSNVLSSTLREICSMAVRGIEQLTYDEYVRDTPNPAHLTILSLEPLPGVAILELPLEAAMGIVDLLLGGHGDGASPARPLSEIESSLVRTMVDRALDELAYAFESVASLTPGVVQQESNPQFAQIAAPSDMSVVIRFELKIGAQETLASLCYPYTLLQPILEAISLASGQRGLDGSAAAAARERMAERLLDVDVELAVEFSPARMSSSELVALRVGDTIQLGHPVDAPLTATVAGVPTFQVRPAQRGKRLAAQIAAHVDPHSRSRLRRIPSR